MSERSHHSVEHATHRHEASVEKLAAERLKHIERSSEHHAKSKRERIEKAREVIQKSEPQLPQHEAAPSAEPSILRPVLTQAANYRQTMVSLQHRMKPAAREFSRFIHSPAVENVSEVIGKTVLRPSISLGATTSALVVTGILYFAARYYGFELRGSEVWISLIIGGVLGVLIEAIARAVRRASGHLR
jgi:membrane-bound ClpP family serine protease